MQSETLIAAAKAVLAQWDTPNWKLTEPTAKLMADLRKAVDEAALSAAEPPNAAQALMIGSYVNDAAHNLLVKHTGSEGGCPTVNWYKLRDEIALAIEKGIDTFTARPSLAAEYQIKRLRNKVAARDMTDKELADEIKAVDEACKGGFGEGGGSPGEWWYERADELEHERKRRELESQLKQHNSRASLSSTGGKE